MEKCCICNKQFSNKSNLRKHVKNVHEKIIFKCEICAKELSRKDNLQSHKRDVHYRSRKFVCLECKIEFSRKGNLLAHKKVCCRIRQCHEQLSPSEFKNHICSQK